MPLTTSQTLVSSIPPPPFQNLELGPVTLHGYGLCIGIAIVLAFWMVEKALSWQHVDTTRLYGVLVPTVIAGFVGARVYHIISSPSRFVDHPVDMLKVWEGGLGIYGAVLFGAIAALVLAPRNGIPRGAVADAAAPALLLSQSFGRFGNYLNQELFGKPTDLPWALEVELHRRPAGLEQEATYHPTFLYEQLGNIMVLTIILVLLRRWTTRPPGSLMAIYIAGYATVRLFTEQFRIDPITSFGGMRQNAWVALGLIIVGVAMLAAMLRRHRAATAAAGDTSSESAAAEPK